MAAVLQMDAQALHIVADEVSTTLGEVRALLEAATDKPGDLSSLEQVADLLRQVRGVLRVVEVYGGALLAEEMEQAARWLAPGGDLHRQEEGLDALVRAVVQLPTYLERVLGGSRDLALVLLPLLNDLRSFRGAPLLSEGTLLSLNLTSKQQPLHAPGGEPELTVAQWARRLRPGYQVALLGLIRGDRQQAHLDALAGIAAHIEGAAVTAPVYQLWWVVGAVLEAVRDGGLECSLSVKRLLGHADRELRRLYESGEQAYADQPPLELLNNLLYYVARAKTDGTRVTAVRESFRIAELLPLDDSIEDERSSLSLPSVKLMHTVGAAIKEDLGRVKDALDLFTRKGGQPEELAQQVELLKKIGDTLAVLGLGSLREQVQAELGRLGEVVARRAAGDADGLIGIAAALISVEDSLDEGLVQLIMPPGAPAAGVPVDPEFRLVTEAVLRECGINLARIKEIVTQAMEPDAQMQGIDSIVPLTRGVTASLLVLGKTRAMEIMQRVSERVVDVLRPGMERPPARVIDRLADALVSIEYYLETLQAGRGDPWYILDNAERCLSAVGAPASDDESARALAAVAPSPDATVVLEAPFAAPPPAREPAATAPVDPELFEVFVEEAREETAVVRKLFALWDENAADRESLIRVRRAFHTMKGSGRMVGAVVLGDLAWAVENLLNRIIDGTRTRSPEMMVVFREVVAALPGLIDALERGEPAAPAIAHITARAAALALDGTAPAGPRPAKVESTGYDPTLMIALDPAGMAKMLERVPPVGAKAPPAAPPPTVEDAAERERREEAEAPKSIDYSLQDIYRKEMQSHLEVMRGFLRRAWTSPGSHQVTEQLYRACHTLRGASRTAESSQAVRLAEPLHRWLRRLFDHGRSFDDEGLSVLADMVAAFEDVLERVHLESLNLPVVEEMVSRVSAADLALEQVIAAEPEQDDTASVEIMPAGAVPEEPVAEQAEPEGRLSIDHLIPGIRVDTPQPRGPQAAEFGHLLPPLPEQPTPGGEVPYLGGQAASPSPVQEEPAALPDISVPEAPPTEAPPTEAVHAAPAELTPEPAVLPESGRMDYDADIAAIFSEEATELLEAADGAVGALRAERGSRERVIELQRALHTIKGGARMAGIRAMGDLSHELESLLTQVTGGTLALDERTFEVMQATLDELNRMRDFVNVGRPVVPARDLITRIQMVARGTAPAPVVEPPSQAVQPAEPVGEAAELPVEEEPETGVAVPLDEPSAAGEEAAEAEAAALVPLPGREAAGDRVEMARVDAELLDSMLNSAGEASIFRARVDQQLGAIEFNLTELNRVVQRLKEQLRKLEIETEAQILHRHVDTAPRRDDFDPLELDRYSAIQQYSRALAETASDVASVQGLLGSLTREAQEMLTQQGRAITDLQNGLMRTRMVPFRRHVQRLTRIVRQAAAESGKKVDLVVTGAAGEFDRQVLERMLPPLEHLLRNAVVHGIESLAERSARGKPDMGRIDLTLRREGAEVVVTVADDGAGVNLRAVREKALALGIVEPKQELTDEQAMQLILESGFSTAAQVTQSAGRGVGMDVVATEVKKLGGAMFMDSSVGQGTTFTARLPFTLAISQALIVRVGDEFFALPLPTVEGVVRVPAAEAQRQLTADGPGFEYGGQHYRFQHLAAFVGGAPAPPAEHDPAVSVILVRAGEHSTGLVTDELVGSREIVVKSVGPQIATVRGVSGATILGDGRICIILDVGALVRSEWRTRTAMDVQAAERVDKRAFALVVDDSITVRRVTQRLLERNGMRVLTAKDGLDAISVLQDHLPDVILLDIEMPRMDGYEVASYVRNDPRLKDVPIVMITSRVGEKHRARAIELGVNDYLGKPYQEAQLMQALEPLLQRSRAT